MRLYVRCLTGLLHNGAQTPTTRAHSSIEIHWYAISYNVHKYVPGHCGHFFSYSYVSVE